MNPSVRALGCLAALALAACAPFRDDSRSGLGDPFALRCGADSQCIDSLPPSGLAALRFNGSAGQAQRQLVATLASFADAQILQVDPRRIKAVFTGQGGVMDELEFNINEQDGRVDFRVRSRSGRFDAGRNRSRLLEFGNRFAARMNG
jgi:uncharacterized protein (DUF1499 family)